jgi:hypothetical protein
VVVQPLLPLVVPLPVVLLERTLPPRRRPRRRRRSLTTTWASVSSTKRLVSSSKIPTFHSPQNYASLFFPLHKGTLFLVSLFQSAWMCVDFYKRFLLGTVSRATEDYAFFILLIPRRARHSHSFRRFAIQNKKIGLGQAQKKFPYEVLVDVCS